MKTSDSNLKLLVDRREIRKVVKRLAGEINRDYSGKSLLAIGVLKGSFMFMADLIRLLKMPVEVDFIQCSSYGAGTESCGRVRIKKGLKGGLSGRDVLVVEDIIDTGLTIFCVMDYLRKKNPDSLRLCALSDKPARHQKEVSIDYLGLKLPDKFIVGYGLDMAERYRNLPDLYEVVS